MKGSWSVLNLFTMSLSSAKMKARSLGRKPNVFQEGKLVNWSSMQCLTWGKIRRHYSSRCHDKEISEASHVSTEQVAICKFSLRKMNIKPQVKICHFHRCYDLSFSIWLESWNSVTKLLYGYNCCCICHYFCCCFCDCHCLYLFRPCYLCRFIANLCLFSIF